MGLLHYVVLLIFILNISAFALDDTNNSVIKGGFVKEYLPKKHHIYRPDDKFSSIHGTRSGLYIGAANTFVLINRRSVLEGEKDQVKQLALSIRFGYDLTSIVGLEVRGTYGMFDKQKDNNMFNNIAIYLKPNINFSNRVNIYTLFGYGKSSLYEAKRGEGVSYGLGLKYSFVEYVALYIDGVNYLKLRETNSMFGLNIGFEYQFKKWYIDKKPL